ncbi:MAG: radical SAM protein, partial [Deltaproteobacteria bacterium]|nr:radical SAM protein [Deltaproteobacteria bacterium]
MKPEFILINPWIYDFAAYDLWSKPLGLLTLAGFLRSRGGKIRLIDCMDVHHPAMTHNPSLKKPIRRAYGTGKFWREKVPKPPPLKHVSRSYSRYGISRQAFVKDLEAVKNPAAILVTSLMTYWYPGVQEAVSLAKKIHPHTPVILGGIYARLCRDHAFRFSGSDRVVNHGDPTHPEFILSVLEEFGVSLGGTSREKNEPCYPAFDLLRKIDYICLLTSTGCPFRCQYCASHFLNPEFSQRDPHHVLEEVLYWHKNYGVKDFAFYDDALLLHSETHMSIFLEALIGMNLGLRFHTPNALHVREITPEIAGLLQRAGFRTIRLGLETSDSKMHQDLDQKVSEGEFERAVSHLKKSGFLNEQIGAYILMGLPGQSVESVMNTIRFVSGTGAMPYLAEYSPLPHTLMWKKAVASSEYDLASEPLFHNNTLLPCWNEDERARVPELKKLVREARHPIRIVRG